MESKSPPSPFSFPQFRAIWLANLVSNMGFLIQSVGAAWLMTTIADSPRLVAMVQSSVALPIMLLALIAGAFADNFDRRKVMIAAQSFMLTVSLCLSLFTYLGLLSPYLLLGMTFLVGCGQAMNAPAWQASVGDLVPKQTLPSAVAYNSVAFNIARSAGPAIGGAIVAAAGAAAAFLVNCFSYVGLILVLLRWQPPPKPDDLPPERIGNAVAGGLRYVAMSPHLLRILLRGMLFAGASAGIPSMMPLAARDLLGGNSIVYGVMLGAFGIGAVGGALTGPWLRRSWSTNKIVGMASLAVAIGAAVTAVSSTLITAMPALALAGAGWMLAMSTFNVTVQLSSPRWVVARAISVYQMAAFGSMAICSWLYGTAAADLGVSRSLLFAALFQLLGVAIGFLVRLPDVEELNLDPLHRWTEPATAVPVEARSGPVVIALRYHIEQDDVPEFLAAMSERRRQRRRDGARRWTLYRDLSDNNVWIERYHVPTWLDYVRHNQRRTHADAPNSEFLWRLNRGSERPEVQRLVQVQPGDYHEDHDFDFEPPYPRGYTETP